MHNVSISPSVGSVYGNIKIAYAFISKAVVTPTPPRLKKIARSAEADIRARLAQSSFANDKNITTWLSLAERMGLRDDELPAHVALFRRITSGRDIYKINAVVDSGNITSARFLCPVGLFDADRIQGDITLRLSQPDETFCPMLSNTDVRLKVDEIVYADSSGIFSRYSKDCDRTKITESSTSLFCVLDGTEDIPIEHLISARAFLLQTLRDSTGAQLEVFTGELSALDK